MGVKAKRGGGRRPSDRVLYVGAGLTNEQMAARDVEERERAADPSWKFAVRIMEREEDARERRADGKGTCSRCFARRALNRACFC